MLREAMRDLNLAWRYKSLLPSTIASTKSDRDDSVIPSEEITRFVLSRSNYSALSSSVWDSQEEDWFFINGMLSTMNSLASNCAALECAFNKKFFLVYDDTTGVYSDIAKCIIERIAGLHTPAAFGAFSAISKSLSRGRKVKVICHSHGGVVMNTAMQIMVLHGVVNTSNLEIYTFANASIDPSPIPRVFKEHFVNNGDFITHVGINCNNYAGGTTYAINHDGHSFKDDYLMKFLNKEYCGGNSMLYQLVNIDRNTQV